MEEPCLEVVVETRKETIFSPSGEGEPITRRACFLNPYNGGPSSPEASPLCLSPLAAAFDPKKCLSSVHWKEHMKDWKPWVEKMQTLHGETWRRAGIYEAVMGSTCEIIKETELVVELAERWCPATKTFVFPWGEATVTLEDMAIIGGYSVLGSPVFSSLDTKEMVEVQELLVESRLKMVRGSARKANSVLWMREFKDGGSKIEHEAFLALWLSRFVLANIKDVNDVISGNSFPIAVLLARGTRVALAPAVLARIYYDLTLFKEKIDASKYNEEDGDDFAVTIRFPLQLVQVWSWERFLDLQPEPNAIRSNDALLAKWDKVKPVVKEGNMRLLLETSKGKFMWRPYAKSVNHRSLAKVYAELGNRLVLSSDSDEDLLAFARFLRSSELVGIGCIEQYLPHRVAMQFGFDQDVPCSVRRCPGSPKIAWRCYNHSEKELMCYLPSCLDGAGVTTQYLEWWQSSVGIHQSKHTRIPLQKKTAIGRMSTNTFKYKREGNEVACNFDTTARIKKAWRAGSSANQDGNGGAKRVGSLASTPNINKEWRGTSIAKRLKVPVGKTSRETEKRPSKYFKGTTKTSNGPKHVRKSNTSDTSRVKRSNVAGTSQKHNGNISSADRREEAQVLPISTDLWRKSSDDAGMQNTSIPSPPRKTREDSSFLGRNKSLVRILFASQNLVQRFKRKGLENSNFDARAAARKIARTSAVVAKYKELNEIHKCSVPPGFQSKDLTRENHFEARELNVEKHSSSNTHDENVGEVGDREKICDPFPLISECDASPRITEPPITTVEIVDLEEAAEGTCGCNGEANSTESGHSKVTTAIEIIDLETIIDLDEYPDILGDDGAPTSARAVGCSEVGTESEVRIGPAHGIAADDDNLDSLDRLRPELAARMRSLKADFARLIAERMQRQ